MFHTVISSHVLCAHVPNTNLISSSSGTSSESDFDCIECPAANAVINGNYIKEDTIDVAIADESQFGSDAEIIVVENKAAYVPSSNVFEDLCRKRQMNSFGTPKNIALLSEQESDLP